MTSQQIICSCGSGNPYQHCCQGPHLGQPATTPEALMRSRYSAFVLKLNDYLLTSWHPETRPSDLTLDGTPEWASLQILSSEEGDTHGTVHFRAVYRTDNGWGYLEECADFIRENGQWYYHSGNPEESTLKPRRNDQCPCGSGKKFKTCCL